MSLIYANGAFLQSPEKPGNQLNPKLLLLRRPLQDYEKMIIPVVKTTSYTTFPFQGNQTILMLPNSFLKIGFISVYSRN